MSRDQDEQHTVSSVAGSTRRLAGFDGLRAIAALSVFGYHFSHNVVFWRSPTELFDILNQLRFGVWIFFVLSGFLLYRPYAAAHRDGLAGRPAAVYLRNRARRVLPAYVVALVLLTYVFHVHPTSTRWSSFLTHLGLLQIYVRSELTLGLDVTWSLATEVSFYLFVPLYAAALWRAQRGRNPLAVESIGLGTLFGTGLAWQIGAAGHVLQSAWLPSFLPVFASGMALGVVVEYRPTRVLEAAQRLARHGLVAWAAAIAVLVVKGIVSPTIGFHEGFTIGPQALYTFAAVLIVAPCALALPGSTAVRVLELTPLRFVGVVSYGVFLWHLSVIRWTQFEWIPLETFPGRTLVVLATSLAVTIGIATASWYVVERPMLGSGSYVRRQPRGRGSGERGVRTR